MIYIIIVLVFLLLIEGVYATLLSSRIHKLELLNINYGSKIIELETPKVVNEEKLDKLVHKHIDEWENTLPKTTMAWADGFKVGYREAMEG